MCIRDSTMAIVFQKPSTLTDAPLHYCPGCTHGIVHRLVAQALEELLSLIHISLDTPTLPPELYSIFEPQAGRVFIDAGGDDAGVTAVEASQRRDQTAVSQRGKTLQHHQFPGGAGHTPCH